MNWKIVIAGFKKYYKWVLYPLVAWLTCILLWSWVLKPALTFVGIIDSGKQTYYTAPQPPAEPDRIWIGKDPGFKPAYHESFIILHTGENEIPIPKKLGIKLGDSEDGTPIFYKSRSGQWLSYESGATLNLGKNATEIILKVAKKTEVYRQYYYRPHNRLYVASKYKR